MEKTIGQKISMLRKDKGITQDGLAERLGVSPQAVSKWENDISCPDITLLPKLAQQLGITIDELLSNDLKKEISFVPVENRKRMEEMMLKIIINSSDGEKVNINLPMALVKVAVELGMAMPQVSNNNNLQGIKFDEVIKLVQNGAIGKLMQIESSDGDIVEIVVE